MKNTINATSGRSRSIYESVPKREGVTRTQSYLRLESGVLGTQSSVDFAALTNEQATGATQVNETEKRLAITDNFIVTEMGFFLLKVTTAGTNRGFPVRTFPNSIEFSGSSEAANLMNLYNGSLKVTINGDVILDSWDLMRHYRVGIAQKAVNTATYGATTTVNNFYVEQQWDNASYGMFPVTPCILLRGTAKNQLRISCPASVAMAGTATSNYAVLILRGFLDQNGSGITR